MKLLFTIAALLLTTTVWAQSPSGFAALGVHQDTNDARFASASGGVVFDLPTEWLSAGAQGDLFVSYPYVAGRGTVFAQGNVVPRRSIRPFALAGFGFGESAGPMIGAGVEIWRPNGRGLRVTVQDYLARIGGFECGQLGYDQTYCATYLHGGDAYIAHQLSVLVGFAWR